MWAVQELSINAEQESVLTFLQKCLSEDPSWAVRRAALNSIAEGQADIQPYGEQGLQDQHSQVRATAVRLLGTLQQPQLAEEFIRIYETDDSYIVQAEAIRALGKLKNNQHRSFFEKAATEKAPRDILRQAAKWALEQLK